MKELSLDTYSNRPWPGLQRKSPAQQKEKQKAEAFSILF
jgi:hypothetical protein